MKTSIVTIALLAMGAASTTTFASPSARAKTQIIEALKAAQSKSLAKAPTDGQRCTDFSGDWKGSCTDSQGQTYDDETMIAQDGCVEVRIDGTSTMIGGLLNLAEPVVVTNAMVSVGNTVDFNASLNGLRQRMEFFARSVGSDTFTTMELIADYQIVNGQLVVKTTEDAHTEISGRPSRDSYWAECTYEKPH